jgi:hypothetical protein
MRLTDAGAVQNPAAQAICSEPRFDLVVRPFHQQKLIGLKSDPVGAALWVLFPLRGSYPV